MQLILSKSLNHLAYLLVCLNLCIVCVSTLSHSSHFKDAALIDLVKCCAPDEHLISNNISTLQCVSSSSDSSFSLFEVVAPNISTFAETGICATNLNCVDFLRDGDGSGKSGRLLRVFGANCQVEIMQKFDYYPKCCPRNLVYDSRTHQCTEPQSAGDMSNDDYLQVRKIGLSTCPAVDFAVVDFESSFTIKGPDAKLLRLESGETFNYGDYCLEHKNDSNSIIVRGCLKRRDACGSKRRCLWKCCPDGQSYVLLNTTKQCVPKINAGITVSEIKNQLIDNKEDHNFGVIHSNLNLGYFLYKPPPSINFKIQQNGDIEAKIDYVVKHFDVSEQIYCIDHYERDSVETQFVYMFIRTYNNTWEIFKGVILFISVFFAILTFICYAILPEIRNVYGKCIMMECLTLILGSLLLGYTKLFSMWSSYSCTTLGYGIIFAFLGLFAWLNVICVDMWLTFGVVKGFKVRDKKSELRKFLMYCCYGVGFPTIMIVFMLIAQMTKFLPESLTPKIGTKTCYFESDTSADYIVYFLVPITVMQIINVILFVKTIMYCIRVKNEMQMMRDGSSNEKKKRMHSFKADKEKLILLLKLFLIMGIPWLFEVISSFVSFKEIGFLRALEIALDAVNCAKGITIFIVFILKQNVLNLLMLKFGLKKPQPRRSTELTSLTMTSNAI